MAPTAPKVIATRTDPGSQLWMNRDREAVTGLRVWGTAIEHDFPADFDRIWVGQDPAGDDVRHVVRIDHPTVSRRHATIEWRGPHLVVVDHGSKNGTRSGGQSHGILELVPGAIVSFGAVDLVAYNARTQRVRAGLRRFLGYGPAAQLAIEQLQHGAALRQPIALLGPSGSGGPALARYLHDTAPANQWPFVAPPKMPAPSDRANQRALVASAAYGTLVLDTHHRGVRVDQVRHLCDVIAGNAYHVRLVLVTNPGTSLLSLEHLVGDQLLTQLLVVQLPPLLSRIAELPRLLDDAIAHHCVRLGVAGDVLHATDAQEILGRVTHARRGRRRIETWEQFDETVERLIALRKTGTANGAEASLGLARGTLSRWASAYDWTLPPPGRPRKRDAS